MANTNINIRMDADLKRQFEAFCADMGMTMTTAFNVFARKAVREYRIPFEISGDVPNAETVEAIQEVKRMKAIRPSKNVIHFMPFRKANGEFLLSNINGTCGVGCEEDWASHFLEHEISAIYGVTHGAGLSVIFPAWMTWMVEHNVGKIAQYAVRVWGVPESEDKKAVALEGIGKLKAFFSSLGLPVTFKELGVENPDIDRLADSLHRNKGELVGNYVKLTKLDSKEIYRLACAGE